MGTVPDTHPDATATRTDAAAASHPDNTMARKATISGLSVHTQMSSVAGAPVVYLLGDVADHSPVQVPEGVSLVNIGVDLWEENFSPWCAPRVFAKGPNFGDGAQKTLDTLINQVIPWAESELSEPAAAGPTTSRRSQARRRSPARRTSTPPSVPSSASELSQDRSGSQGFWTT